jgi:D-tyrosyl-tRNA(Tyr) deacylase
MRLLIQRVSSASLTIDHNLYSQINKGLLVLIGISTTDTLEHIPRLAKKLVELRIFEDDNGKMNLSATDIMAELMIVSQFTLYADCRRGRRPDFLQAALPQTAQELYQAFVTEVQKYGLKTETGIFGADMKINLTNDGPVTIMLDSDTL